MRSSSGTTSKFNVEFLGATHFLTKFPEKLLFLKLILQKVLRIWRILEVYSWEKTLISAAEPVYVHTNKCMRLVAHNTFIPFKVNYEKHMHI